MRNNFKDELKMPEERFGNLSTQEHSSPLAVVLGILIVLLMLLLAGLYVWGEYLHDARAIPQVHVPQERPDAAQNNEPESTNAEADVETLSALSTSDEITAIESDLSGTDVQMLDMELNAIEAELSNIANETNNTEGI